MSRFDTGQTLIEVIVGLAVLSLVLVAVVSGVAVSIKGSRTSKNQTLATRYAQEGLEWIRERRDEIGWGPFLAALRADNVFGVTYCLPDLSVYDVPLAPGDGLPDASCVNNPISGTPFTREMTITYEPSASPRWIQAEVVVSWAEGNQTYESRQTGRLTEWDR